MVESSNYNLFLIGEYHVNNMNNKHNEHATKYLHTGPIRFVTTNFYFGFTLNIQNAIYMLD